MTTRHSPVQAGDSRPLRLVVVRHAATIPDPAVPAADWELVDQPLPDGFAASIERCSTWFSSPEPKARQTAALITDQQVLVDARLREVGRGGWLHDYDAAVARHLTAPDEPAARDWETGTEVRHRLHEWLGDLPAGHMSPMGAVTHGLAMTHLHQLLTEQAPTLRWWRQLAMPDVRIYDLPHRYAAGDDSPIV